jgi:pimeloyl-ACP methyl ester carboxylesterase
VAVVYKTARDSARARRLERPRHALNWAATDQEEPYVTHPFRYAELPGGSHWISEEAPDAVAELVLDHVARAA